jgi:hypothetical protein
MINSDAGNAFEWEVVAHCEYIGYPARSALTKSHVDMDAFANVQGAANGATLARAAGEDKTGWASMVKGLASEMWEHRQQIGAVAQNAVNLYRNPQQMLRNF